MFVNEEMERVWTEAVVARFDVVSHDYSGRIEIKI
jgi:hypothetical protein